MSQATGIPWGDFCTVRKKFLTFRLRFHLLTSILSSPPLTSPPPPLVHFPSRRDNQAFLRSDMNDYRLPHRLLRSQAFRDSQLFSKSFTISILLKYFFQPFLEVFSISLLPSVSGSLVLTAGTRGPVFPQPQRSSRAACVT